MRRSPSTTPSRSPYSLRVRRANSSGVSGVSMFPPTSRSRVQHQCKIGVLDAADERAVSLWLELHRTFIDEGVHIVQGPIAVPLDPQAIAKVIVLQPPLVQVRGARVHRFEDLELHAQLGDRPRVALLLHQLLDLGFEVGDLLLVVVHPTDESTSGPSG